MRATMWRPTILAHPSRGLALGVLLALAGIAGDPALTSADDDIWGGIAKDVFGARPIMDDSGMVLLDAPYRAEDAAIVPIKMTIPAAVAARARTLTLIVEKNPAPVVAAFTFGDAAGLGDRTISTRVRVDMYSNVRAVVELDDGTLHMATKFVKAAGGCSAPALKDMDAALAGIGKMKLRSLPPPAGTSGEARSSPTSEALVMVRHPNYSGMQMNQLTGLYIPAKFVEFMELRKGDRLIFSMTGGISLSEDPNIRFSYAPAVPGDLSVVARDTDGKTYATSAPATGS
ncbi:MAG: quinoprotein dehydrogenase-associated SoxYZ-like carrier [Hyphomicrobiaceae bacterium]|nr:quinoprotein dehydrogenase-associated SoxYZ-like carrier [Hyphomicrobiaceae bacterium]